MNRTTILLAGALSCIALLAGCTLRQTGSEVPAATAEPTAAPEPEPEVAKYTVTWRLNGEVLASEQVREGDIPADAPAFSGERAITGWTADGAAEDVWETPVTADRTYDGVTGPRLHLQGGFLSAESDGLFHPFEPFTRSDAARAVYAILADKPTGETFLKDVTTRAKCWNAATALVTGGYMTIDENGRFYPDVPITRGDLTALLEKMFSPGAVREALSGRGEPMTRVEAAEVLSSLLGLTPPQEPPYFPDVAPEAPYYAAVEAAGAAVQADWIIADTARPGPVNLEGYLYFVRQDGYFLADAENEGLYYGPDGRYTSGNTELDDFVAEIIQTQIAAGMSREDMLRKVYDYVRDHYLYLKRNLYEIGATGWEIDEALTMFRTSKGNCYNFTAAFWALARGVGYDAVCYSGLVGVERDPHSWVEITHDGTPYIYDVETEMQNRLNNDYYTSMYKMTYERGKLWSYAKVPYDD